MYRVPRVSRVPIIVRISLTMIARTPSGIISKQELLLVGEVDACIDPRSGLALHSPKSQIPSISPDNSAHEYAEYEFARRLHVPPSTPIFLNVYRDRIERG